MSEVTVKLAPALWEAVSAALLHVERQHSQVVAFQPTLATDAFATIGLGVVQRARLTIEEAVMKAEARR